MKSVRRAAASGFLLLLASAGVVADPGFRLVPGVVYLHPDQRLDIVLATDGEGQGRARRVYSPWGDSTGNQAPNPSPLRRGFSGNERDFTCLHYFHARYYDACLGRFLSADPAGQFRSPVLYAGSSPLDHVDPDGWMSKAQKAAVRLYANRMIELWKAGQKDGSWSNRACETEYCFLKDGLRTYVKTHTAHEARIVEASPGLTISFPKRADSRGGTRTGLSVSPTSGSTTAQPGSDRLPRSALRKPGAPRPQYQVRFKEAPHRELLKRLAGILLKEDRRFLDEGGGAYSPKFNVLAVKLGKRAGRVLYTGLGARFVVKSREYVLKVSDWMALRSVQIAAWPTRFRFSKRFRYTVPRVTQYSGYEESIDEFTALDVIETIYVQPGDFDDEVHNHLRWLTRSGS